MLRDMLQMLLHKTAQSDFVQALFHYSRPGWTGLHFGCLNAVHGAADAAAQDSGSMGGAASASGAPQPLLPCLPWPRDLLL